MRLTTFAFCVLLYFNCVILFYMGGLVDGWIDGFIDGLMVGEVDVIDGRIYGWIDGLTN